MPRQSRELLMLQEVCFLKFHALGPDFDYSQESLSSKNFTESTSDNLPTLVFRCRVMFSIVTLETDTGMLASFPEGFTRQLDTSLPSGKLVLTRPLDVLNMWHLLWQKQQLGYLLGSQCPYLHKLLHLLNLNLQ